LISSSLLSRKFLRYIINYFTAGCRDLARESLEIEDRDIHHCYACTDDIKHPEGSGYKAGHIAGVSYYYED
jgi:hypothetical protein